MKNIRKYGEAPFSTALVHGGPGAPGYLAPVARELSKNMGVLEPLQTAASLQGQILELKAVLEEYGSLPVALIGHSYGAMLSIFFCAVYPAFIKKIILIGSGPLEEKYAERIMETRLNRLNNGERLEMFALIRFLSAPGMRGKNTALARMGFLCKKADCFDPLTLHEEELECQCRIHKKVWTDVWKQRSSGKLLKLARFIQCPVVAIHGDYDPHPAEGVKQPLSTVEKNFNFILLKNCGHYPWLEREAKDTFFKTLKKELSQHTGEV